MALAASFDRENDFPKEARRMQQEEYKADIIAAAEDPTSACVVKGKIFAANELQYLTEVAEGITVSFVCRKLDCLWYGLNSEWPKRLTSEHWCCPICGIKYAPSMYKPSMGNFTAWGRRRNTFTSS